MDNDETAESELCENCDYIINCANENIFIITKGDDDKVWCQSCFEDLWKEAMKDGWAGDDIEEKMKELKKKAKKKAKKQKQK